MRGLTIGMIVNYIDVILIELSLDYVVVALDIGQVGDDEIRILKDVLRGDQVNRGEVELDADRCGELLLVIGRVLAVVGHQKRQAKAVLCQNIELIDFTFDFQGF